MTKAFRRLFLGGLDAAFRRGQLGFFNELASLAKVGALAERVGALQQSPFVVCAKPLFGGPQRALACLARCANLDALYGSATRSGFEAPAALS